MQLFRSTLLEWYVWKLSFIPNHSLMVIYGEWGIITIKAFTPLWVSSYTAVHL